MTWIAGTGRQQWLGCDHVSYLFVRVLFTRCFYTPTQPNKFDFQEGGEGRRGSCLSCARACHRKSSFVAWVCVYSLDKDPFA